MDEKLVFCMKWGTRYGPEYVNRLWRSVRRHVKGDFKLVCFTENSDGVDEVVDCRPLPPFEGVPQHLAVKPWRKLSLWQASLGEDLDGRDALVLDLDVVVTGSLDAFWEFNPGMYAVWENPTKKGSGIGNTSIFRFKVGSHPEIYHRFMADPEGLYRNEFRIEQEFISAVLNAKGEQVFWPKGWCLSFKEDLLPGWPMRWWQDVPLPKTAKVVAFHGKPDPDEAMLGEWPAQGWKKIYKYVRPVEWITANWG
jgi:hypothetical protein